MLKELNKFWLLMPFLVISVLGDCTLNINGKSPTIYKYFGSKKIRISKNANNIHISPDQPITAYCSTYVHLDGFIVKSHNVRKITFECLNNEQLQYKYTNNQNYMEGVVNYGTFISCGENELPTLYETTNDLPNCKPYLTYSIGIPFSTIEQITFARICYNLDDLNLKYVNYLAYRNNYKSISIDNWTKSAPLKTATLNKPITGWDSDFEFMNVIDFEILYDLIQIENPFLYLHNFTYTSIIQDVPLKVNLEYFEKLLNIIWWNNLKDGNWKLYLNTLQERARTHKYDVYTGTFGAVTVPTSKCINNGTLTIESQGKTYTAPKYIWSYIKSLSPNVSEDEFVVIGYNSPFYDNVENIILCKDICDDIDWMKTSLFNKVRRMMTMGLVFCCRPEDVIQAFSDFPMQPQLDGKPSNTLRVNERETTTPNYNDFSGNHIHDEEN